MKFAKEIIELMSPYPGREFRMAEFVRYTACCTNKKKKQAGREAIRLVLISLAETGVIKIIPPEKQGGYSIYIWGSAR